MNRRIASTLVTLAFAALCAPWSPVAYAQSPPSAAERFKTLFTTTSGC